MVVDLRYSPSALGVGAVRWLFKMARSTTPAARGHVNAAGRPFVAPSSRLAQGLRRQAILPHNVPFVLLGAGLLWFGWFGFNAGSAIAAGSANGMFKSASLAFVTTMLAPSATLTVWSILDIARGGKATAVGAATAIVVGLVAITPAAGHVSPTSALLLGGIAAFPSYFAILYRAKTKLDDSLDVVRGARRRRHGRRAATGVFSQKGLERPWSTVCCSATPTRCGSRSSASARGDRYSSIMTFVILKAMGALMALRAEGGDEGVA